MILLHYITVYLDIILIHDTYTSFLYIICTYIKHFSYNTCCVCTFILKLSLTWKRKSSLNRTVEVDDTRVTLDCRDRRVSGCSFSLYSQSSLIRVAHRGCDNFLTSRQRNRRQLMLWLLKHAKILNMFAPPCQNGDPTKYLAVMLQVTLLALKRCHIVAVKACFFLFFLLSKKFFF